MSLPFNRDLSQNTSLGVVPQNHDITFSSVTSFFELFDFFLLTFTLWARGGSFFGQKSLHNKIKALHGGGVKPKNERDVFCDNSLRMGVS